MRVAQRALNEHRRLPRLVRIFRTGQAVGILLLILIVVVSLSLGLPMSDVNAVLLVPVVVFVASFFGVGLLTWRNYQGTADIWAKNVRARGLESAGFGWLVDAGTVRAIGAAKAIFMVIFTFTAIIQTLWP